MDQWLSARGRDVCASDGDKIGSLEDLYYDEANGQPRWLGIGTGFFGTKHVLVPVEGSVVTDDSIQVPFAKDYVKDSPDIDDDDLSPETETSLYNYYFGTTGVTGYERATASSEGGMTGTQETSYDRQPGTGESVVRSEEELRVGKREVEGGRVTLRKWVETQPVEAQVSLERERAFVQREDINQPASGAEIGEQQIDVTLRREEPVVQKDVVAKERITVSKDAETETQTVSDEVRREQVDLQGDVQGDVTNRDAA